MRHIATTLCAALVLLLGVMPAQAQTCDTIEDVTIRQVNALPQANVDALMALGQNAEIPAIRELLTNEFDNPRRPEGADFRCVRVTGVVLSDPRYSGLSSVNTATGIPNRIHFFLRDVAAETDGVEGMTIQVVDDTQSGASLPLRVGDVIELEGFLNIFTTAGASVQRTWQLAPLDGLSIDVLDTVDPEDPILNPVSVTSDQINMVVGTVEGEPVVQPNWANWNSLSGQYVRLEGAQVINSDQNEGIGRPNWAISTLGEDARIASYDLSLRFRNDRAGVYPEDAFFVRAADDPFIAPPPGAIVAAQGFLTFGVFDAFNIGSPQSTKFYLSAITDNDLVLTTSPPVISVDLLTEVPTGDVEVFATVIPGGAAPLTSITINYEFVGGPSGSVPMAVAEGDNRFSGTIPITENEDGLFFSYTVEATDGDGLNNESGPRSSRVLFDGITEISHIQQTINDGQGPSPFAGITTDLDLNAVVMTNPGLSGFISIQDDAELSPWTGVFIFASEALVATLSAGDRVAITRAQIEESFSLTRLRVLPEHITVTASGEPYGYVTGLPTGLFAQDADFAESYEGMALRFEDVTVTQADAGFGEWRFSSDGTAPNAILADDQSPEVPGGNTLFEDGDQLDFIQGVWTFTFSNFKLWPQSMDDIGFKVSTEPGAAAQTIRIDGAYPNPVASRATIAYTLGTSGHVRMEVFDVTGRRVAVLVDAETPAGPQEAALDTAGLASGVYFIRLAADGDVQTTRVVVAR